MNNKPLGKLIVIDGPDGAGKTTACGYIKGQMQVLSKPFKVVNILSGNPTSAQLRKVLTSHESVFSPKAEMLAYAAAVTNTMDNEVHPLLQSGINVLIDRGPFSNFAYQVQNTDSPLFDLWVQIYSEFKADSTLLLSTTYGTGLDRCRERDNALDRIEAKGNEFQLKVSDAYEFIKRAVDQQVNDKNNVFLKIAGKVTQYSNDTTLEQLHNSCMNFVNAAFNN